jgi:biopolymer transport protein ExbD
MKLNRRDLQTVEIQMGPMIDMVFLLLVFFMVTAKPVKPESDVGLSLPGTVAQDAPVDIPDEQRIVLEAGGRVVLNDLPVAEPADRDLLRLVATLVRFREATEANRAKPLVTIDAADTVPHQRIIDTLNACAKARINGVTFATDSTEEEP